MSNAKLIILGAVGGLLEGVLLFLLIDFFDYAPRAVIEPETWSAYGMYILGALGAVSGAVLGLATHAVLGRQRRLVVIEKTVRGLDSRTNRQGPS